HLCHYTYGGHYGRFFRFNYRHWNSDCFVRSMVNPRSHLLSGWAVGFLDRWSNLFPGWHNPRRDDLVWLGLKTTATLDSQPRSRGAFFIGESDGAVLFSPSPTENGLG